MSQVIEHLKHLIRFRTVNTGDSQYQEQFDLAWAYIDDELADLEDWSYREYQINGYKSRVYSHKKYVESDEKDFDLYLYSHLDVVDGDSALFMPQEVDGKVRGRGAIDMKFTLAVNIETLKGMSKEMLEKKIAFLIVSDEEVGGQYGAKHLVDNEGFRGKCVIIQDGGVSDTKWYFELKCKGTIHTIYSAQGKSVHGSRKWFGDNALDRLIDFYQEVKSRFDKGNADNWASTVNIGILKGGDATNTVAASGVMHIDFRYATTDERDEYYQVVEELMQKYRISADHYVDAANCDVEEDNEYVQKYLEVAKAIIPAEETIEFSSSTASNDAREFFKVGMTPLLFMPRSGGSHTPDEWVSKEDVEKLVEINRRFAEEMLG